MIIELDYTNMNKITKWLMCGLIICAIGFIGCSNKNDAGGEVEKRSI